MDDASAFLIPRSQILSSFLIDQSKQDQETLFGLPELDVNAISLSNPYAPKSPLLNALHLPELEPLGNRVEPHKTSSLASDADVSLTSTSSINFDLQPIPPLLPLSEQPDLPEFDEYPWQNAAEFSTLHSESKFLTWESILKQQDCLKTGSLDKIRSFAPHFISEADHRVLDIAIEEYAERQNGEISGNVVKHDVLLRSLWQAGLGRESTLFCFDVESQQFTHVVTETRATGCHLQTSTNLIANFLQIGNMMRILRGLSGLHEFRSKHVASYTALMGALRSILLEVEDHVLRRVGMVKTLLQLKDVFRPIEELCRILMNLVTKVKTCHNNEEIVDVTYTHVQDTETIDDSTLAAIMRHILAHVSGPWLETVEEWSGLIKGSAPRHAIEEDDDKQIPRTTLPLPVSQQDSNLITESRRCLDFLHTYHPDHLLLSSRISSLETPCLEWKFDLDDIDRIMVEANQYEQRLTSALRSEHVTGDFTAKFGAIRASQSNHETVDEADLVATFNETTLKFAQNFLIAEPPSQTPFDNIKVHDDFRSHTANYLNSKESPGALPFQVFRPPPNLALSLSIGPILQIQHKIYTHACLHNLLHDTNPVNRLQNHLALHHTFSLFASTQHNSFYPSQLAQTLFSSELATSERFKGQPRTGAPMGLRLGTGTRRDWPPASSELQLALGNVLGQSWTYQNASVLNLHSSSRPQTPNNTANIPNQAQLPGNMSFTLRATLSDTEINRILDADSIHALDFLRLGYSPPPHLRFLFTRKALARYDAVFALQLQLLRVRFALTHAHMQKEALTSLSKLRFRALALVNALSADFLHTGILPPWTRLQECIARLEATCRSPFPILSTSSASSTNPQRPQTQASPKQEADFMSLTALTTAHGAALDTIAANLLLRRKQARAREALEAWLQACLDLCQSQGDSSSSGGVEAGEFAKAFVGFADELRKLCVGSQQQQQVRRDGKDGSDGESEEARGAKALLEVLQGICGDEAVCGNDTVTHR